MQVDDALGLRREMRQARAGGRSGEKSWIKQRGERRRAEARDAAAEEIPAGKKRRVWRHIHGGQLRETASSMQRIVPATAA